MAAFVSAVASPGIKISLGGNISLCRVRADIEPQFPGRRGRHDEVPNFHGRNDVRGVRSGDQQIGGRTLGNAQRFKREVGIELLPSLRKSGTVRTTFDRLPGLRLMCPMPAALASSSGRRWRCRLDVRRGAHRVFARKGNACLHARQVPAFIGNPEAQHDRFTGDRPGENLVIIRELANDRGVDAGHVANDAARREAIGLSEQYVERDRGCAHLGQLVHQGSQTVPGPGPLPKVPQGGFVYVDDPDRHVFKYSRRRSLVEIECRLANKPQQRGIGSPQDRERRDET